MAAHCVRAVPPDWLEAIAGYAADHGLVRHVHAHRAAARARASAAPSTARSPIELLARTGFLGPRTSVVHAIHVDERDVALLADIGDDRRHLPDDRGQPRRRPPAGAAPTATPACGWRSARTRRCASIPFEETRELETGARREGTTRHALLAHHGDLWAELARNGLASLGLEGGQTIDVDLEHPDLRGVGSDELPLALATCASAGVVARQASRVRAGGGSLS